MRLGMSFLMLSLVGAFLLWSALWYTGVLHAQAPEQSPPNCPTRLELEQSSHEFSKRVAASMIDMLKEQLRQSQGELAALKVTQPPPPDAPPREESK